jgi:hypothetical protein
MLTGGAKFYFIPEPAGDFRAVEISYSGRDRSRA